MHTIPISKIAYLPTFIITLSGKFEQIDKFLQTNLYFLHAIYCLIFKSNIDVTVNKGNINILAVIEINIFLLQIKYEIIKQHLLL